MVNHTGKTVGQILREQREQLGISLEEVSRSTRIKQNYLQELENDHPELFSSMTQARGFLRLYAGFLNLSYSDLIDGWNFQQPDEVGKKNKKQDKNTLSADQEDTTAVNLNEKEFAADHFDDQEDNRSESETDLKAKPSSNQLFKNIQNHVLIKNLFSSITRIKQSLQNKQIIKKIIAGADKKSHPDKARNEGIAVPAASPKSTSQSLYSEIGVSLRERRESMELTLSDIEKFTNIKRMYLVAMEDGRFSDLPSTVQGRGMLNIYAQFLALDESHVMERFASALQLQREELLTPQRKPSPSPVTVRLNMPPWLRKIINPDLLIGGLFIIGLFGFILWGTTQMLQGETASPTEAPSISEVLQTTPTLTPTLQETQLVEDGEPVNGELPGGNEQPAGGEAVPVQPTPIATINAAPLQLYIIAHDRAYMRIIVDNVELFNGRVIPDNVYTYSGQNQIELLTGNGAALEVYFNQEYLGELGGLGDVASLSFSSEGLVSSTPEPTVEADQEMPAE